MHAVAGDVGAAREASDVAATDGSGHAGTGSNARSFRFLLTLALRKAQTAVTLDNGGHVDEAIRTYREAISMLGLVLDRTSEEDGRQRLLHFRQTYSDRVSVLSSLRPTHTTQPLAAGLEGALNRPMVSYPARQQPQQALSAVAASAQNDGAGRAGSPWTRAARLSDKKPDDRQLSDSATADGGDGDASPLSAHTRLQGPTGTSSDAESVCPPTQGMLAVTLPERLDLESPGEPLRSPVNQNKPLPYVLGTPEAPTVQRKLSTASNDTSDSATQASEPSADHAAAAAAAGDAGSTPQPSASGQSTIAASADRRAPAGNGAGAADSAEARPSDKAARRKARDKDSEKASRRQSIKNQRSLPAMFGIGAKAKNDSKAAPPVPPLMVPEHNASHFGRRLLGALRNTPSGDPQTGRQSASRDNSEDVGSAEVPRSGGGDAAGAVGPGELGTAELLREAAHEPEPEDGPPPTPSKDSPLTPSKDSPPPPEKGYGKTLTREQKRQSNAAHRLAGLFKRKPSIPEIPTTALPTKFPADAGGPPGSGYLQSPPSARMMPKDRRLSASASTPNLFEAAAAAAAASSDQPALAVFQATERGVLPPMPAPPTLRPSLSVADPAPGSTGDVARATDRQGGHPAMSVRAERSDSVSSAQPVGSAGAHQYQSPNIRPPLRIATKSALEVMTFGPEDTPLPAMPMTACVDGASRSRKSSINTAASHPAPRTSGVMAHGAAPSIVGGSVGGGSMGGGGSSSLEAPGHLLNGRATLVDVEEDQRLELFEPSFGTFHPDLGPPPAKASPLAALWFMNTLHRSMVTGGAHLTTSLYVPRRLWFQSGIRIMAIDAKLGVLGQLTQSFASIGTHLTLPDIDALIAAAGLAHDEQRSETAPWETDEGPGRGDRERDDLHRSCVALHHWLNSLEDTLDSSRRLLSKRLKFVSTSASGLPPPAPAAHAGASIDNFQGSMFNMSFVPVYGGDGMAGAIGNGMANGMGNGSLQNLVLGHGDLASSSGMPVSPLSPGGDPMEARLSEARASETLNGSVAGSIAPPTPSANRDALGKDQLGNSRFKGLGKLGKSVDRIYSSMQKEKLDDTSAYVAALQRLFEVAMILEDLMHYFARIAGDDELAGWFADAPQSPAPVSGRRGQERSQERSQGDAGGAAPASPAPPAPPAPQTGLASEPSMSSMNSGSERKSSSASISAVHAVADKKIRRRSNYFGQRQLSTGLAESMDAGAPVGRVAGKPRGESLSVIPRIVPAVPMPMVTPTASANSAMPRFVLAQSPIKNPASYVRQGRGRAPGVIYARLSKVTEWLSQVLVAWVVRDLQVLYAKYIKRLREWSSE